MKPRPFQEFVFPILAILVGLAALLNLALHKTVTLVVDGQSQPYTVYAITVNDLLRTAGTARGEADRLTPPGEAWLPHNAQVTLERAAAVQVQADGRIINLVTPERMPLNIMALAGFNLGPGDRLLWMGQPLNPTERLYFWPGSSIVLQLQREQPFTLTENGSPLALRSTAPSLGQALWENGILLYTADRLTPPPATPLTADLQATLERSHMVTVQTQSATLNLRSAAATVGEALAEAGLALQGLDYSLPPANEPLPADGLIRLVRVREEVLIEQTPLAFETEYQPVTDLPIDTQNVIQTGEYGLTAQRLRVRYEDGVEVARMVEDEWEARPPQNRILGYGTQVTLQTAVVDGVTIEYWRSLTMWATSYYPGVTSPITYSGLPLKKGVCAVDIRYIPLYTRMYVPGYGDVLAADIGGGVVGRMIDLGYSDDDWISWHQYVTVYFLWPPPDNIVYIIP